MDEKSCNCLEFILQKLILHLKLDKFTTNFHHYCHIDKWYIFDENEHWALFS